MRGRIMAALLMSFACMGLIVAHTRAPQRIITTLIKGLESPRQLTDLKLEPFGAGTVMYQGAEVTWFAATETLSDTVGVAFVTPERMKRGSDPGMDFPIILELLYGEGEETSRVLSYFILGEPPCERTAIDDSSCDYRKLVNDVMQRLSRVPEFSNVCFEKCMGIDKEEVVPCLKVQ